MRVLLTLASILIVTSVSQAQVRPTDLDVTDGKIQPASGHRLSVSTKEMRATLKFTTEQTATVKFTYLGPLKDLSPTKAASRPAGPNVISQFGLKLRAQNDCNAIYVLWRFAPDQKIVVGIQRNPGKRTHPECLDRGYINNLKPRLSDAPPPVEPSQPHVPAATPHVLTATPHALTATPHVLTATMNGSDLSVTADNKLVWWGDLGPTALTLRGPVGLRSDNARLLFDLLVNR